MRRSSLIWVIALLLLTAAKASALVMTVPEGMWPKDWPAELESLREHAVTLDVATGTQEHIYTIHFDNREEFEKHWPILMTLRTPGSPLTVSKVGSDSGWGDLLSNAKPCVRIKGPTGSIVGAENLEKLDQLIEEGKAAIVAPPWPKELVGSEGQLPEYVTTTRAMQGKLQWVAVEDVPAEQRGFSFRARVDIELVVDGQVIDLNRIVLPDDARIIDRRFAPSGK